MVSKIKHISINSSHYDAEAESYDAFNEASNSVINQHIEQVLKKHDVKTVLDLTCGTGSQVFWLTKVGFSVTGYDINEKMLSIARCKAKEAALDIKFHKGDMRNVQAGSFDAVVTIFNSIGHLTREDFKKAIKNISSNLNQGGLYIFDIFNTEYLRHKDNITKLTIDWQKKLGETTYREIQYSTIDGDGVLASHDIYLKHKAGKEPIITNASQTLQTYTAKELSDMLQEYGFELVFQLDIDGSEFNPLKTERLFTVAQKNCD